MPRVRAVLLDLDDTLLINDMETFSPHYYAALSARVAPWVDSRTFLNALSAGVRAMFVNDGSGGTNAEVFARAFYPRLDVDREQLEAQIEAFYRDDFPSLGVLTGCDKAAVPLLRLLRERGYQVAIATQPVFPLIAVLERLRWAGLESDAAAYDLVACYEILSACKPSPAFFKTLCTRLHRQPSECLMVGDSPDADLPARRVGIKTFWVNRRGLSTPQLDAPHAEGDLEELIRLVETGGIHDL